MQFCAKSVTECVCVYMHLCVCTYIYTCMYVRTYVCATMYCMYMFAVISPSPKDGERSVHPRGQASHMPERIQSHEKVEDQVPKGTVEQVQV